MMTNLYDLSNDEIVTMWKQSSYNPLSRNKNERKLKTFIDFLNERGIKVEKGDVHAFQERGFFGTEYYIRIFNPHCTHEDDEVCRNVLLFTL